jgi:hypothetical protein
MSSLACRFDFENGRGQKLHGVEFIPPSGSKQWASLVWNHGVCEHKERYVPGEGLLSLGGGPSYPRAAQQACCSSRQHAVARTRR